MEVQGRETEHIFLEGGVKTVKLVTHPISQDFEFPRFQSMILEQELLGQPSYHQENKISREMLNLQKYM